MQPAASIASKPADSRQKTQSILALPKPPENLGLPILDLVTHSTGDLYSGVYTQEVCITFVHCFVSSLHTRVAFSQNGAFGQRMWRIHTPTPPRSLDLGGAAPGGPLVHSVLSPRVLGAPDVGNQWRRITRFAQASTNAHTNMYDADADDGT